MSVHPPRVKSGAPKRNSDPSPFGISDLGPPLDLFARPEDCALKVLLTRRPHENPPNCHNILNRRPASRGGAGITDDRILAKSVFAVYQEQHHALDHPCGTSV